MGFEFIPNPFEGLFDGPPTTADFAGLPLTIEEVGGEKRSLRLSGSALPFSGDLKFSGKSQLVTTHYGSRSAQQLVGHNDEPTSMSGVWSTVRLSQGSFAAWSPAAGVPSSGGGGFFSGLPQIVKSIAGINTPGPLTGLRSAQAIEGAVEELRRGGELLRVTYEHRVRYGRIALASFTQKAWGEIGWSLKFEWVSRSDTRPVLKGVPAPDTASNFFVDAMNATLNSIEWFENKILGGAATGYQDIMDRYIRGPLAVWNAGGRAFARAATLLDTAVYDTAQVGIDFVNGANTYRDAANRIGDIGATARGQAHAMSMALGTLSPEEFAATDDPLLQLQAGEELGSAKEFAAASPSASP